MNAKPILFLSCFLAVTLAASVVTAAPRGGNHFTSMPARGGRTFTASEMGTWRGQHWSGGNWGGNWHHHHHDHFNNDVIFIGGFGGFPFWGWGWGWGYPYGYYGYSPYGYYGNGYYGSPSYGGYGYGYGGYGYGYGDRSRVAGLQRRLAQAGYYHGSIDGIMGPRTRRALRAYQRDHGTAYGMTDRQLLPAKSMG
jgi:hypothetical protein